MVRGGDVTERARPRRSGRRAVQRERAVRTYSDARELLSTVAYAEVRAIMLAWAGLLREDPVALARRAIDAVLRAGRRYPSARTFGEAVRGSLRSMTAAPLYRAARRLGAPPWDTLGDGQLGDVAGLEFAFHLAADAAAIVRAKDPQVLAAAAARGDDVRTRLAPERKGGTADKT